MSEHSALQPSQLHALRKLGAEIKAHRPAPAFAKTSAGEEGAFFFVERGEISAPTVQATLGMRALQITDGESFASLWRLQCHAADHLYTEHGKVSIVQKYTFSWDDEKVYQAERTVLVRGENAPSYPAMPLEARLEHGVVGVSDLAIASVAIEDDFRRVTEGEYDELFEMSAGYLREKTD